MVGFITIATPDLAPVFSYVCFFSVSFRGPLRFLRSLLLFPLCRRPLHLFVGLCFWWRLRLQMTYLVSYFTGQFYKGNQARRNKVLVLVCVNTKVDFVVCHVFAYYLSIFYIRLRYELLYY